MTKDTGVVMIHNREYTTVAARVQRFREAYKLDYSIETKLVSIDDDTVVMKAIIKNTDGMILATGYAEERRNASQINRSSALENCETSAIGRALAAFGMAGTEYASADEVAQAITVQNQITKPSYNSYNYNQAPKSDKAKAYMDSLKQQIKGNLNTAGLTQPEEQINFVEELLGKKTIETIDEAKEVLNEAQALNDTSVTDEELAAIA